MTVPISKADVFTRGHSGDGPGPLPDWEPQSCWCCCLWGHTRCVLPSPGFPGEVPSLNIQKQSWAAATAQTWMEEQAEGRTCQTFPVQGGRSWDLKPVVGREPQATPSSTWLDPGVVGKWEINWPHTHRVVCFSTIFSQQGCSLPGSCLCPGETGCRELRTHPRCSHHLASMRPPLCEHPHTRNKGLQRSSKATEWDSITTHIISAMC